jgi:hypothetical protein
MADAIGSSDIHGSLARFSTREGFPSLVLGELGLTTKANPVGHSPLSTLACSRKDQGSLELGKAAQHREHQPAMSGACVSPPICDRHEPRARIGNLGKRIE